MSSIWKEEIEMPRFPCLDSDKTVDTLIIGGGMAGLLCGHFLNAQNKDYMILEKDRICGGTTGNTTAKISRFPGLVYSNLIKKSGEDHARRFLQANEQACKVYHEMCSKIDCDYSLEDNYIYSLEERGKARIAAEVEAVKSLGGYAVYTEQTELPFEITAAIKTVNQACFHPLKFAKKIAKNQKIYEESFVKHIKKQNDRKGYEVIVNSGSNLLGKHINEYKVMADRVIVCTHYPVFNLHGMYFVKLYQHRSYVLALEADTYNFPKAMYVGEKHEELSLRRYKNYLLLGGCGGKTGSSSGGFERLRKKAREAFPYAKEVGSWAAQDCMSLDQIPYIGHYSPKTEDLFVASGFNKWGMTGSMMAALTLTGQMSDELSEVFRPDRKMINKQFFLNVLSADKAMLTPTTPRCRHLGCALKWNEEEQSWDCPCHGSRYKKDGKILNNPTQNEL